MTAKKLVILESPNKISKFKQGLGSQASDFNILASFGHLFSLEGNNKGVDVQNDFSLNMYIPSNKKEHADKILKAAKQASVIYLATDPDREGEGIAFDIMQYLRKHKVMAPIDRVTFNELTPKAIQEAMNKPRKVDQFLVDAQSTRRALDYLIGFNTSPLLWKRVGPNTSAGRVQTPALHLLCERQKEIQNFIPTPYHEFGLGVQEKNGHTQKIKLNRYKGIKAERISKDEPIYKEINGDVDTFHKNLMQIKEVKVLEIKERPNKRNPYPPFTTSTLQQAGFSRHGYSVDKVMNICQGLFEKGYITYHRTDTVRISNEFMFPMRDKIKALYGERYLHPEVRAYKTKAVNAQEAHECVRPTSLDRLPEDMVTLTNEERRMYTLIYNRTIASQMASMEQLTTTIHFGNGDYTFKTSGTVTLFDGFTKVYGHEEKDVMALQYKVGDTLKVDHVIRDDKQTEPPPYYNESSFVKLMEETGIGRPSTYASTIKTLKDRGYVSRNGAKMEVTPRGLLVNQFMSQHLTRYTDTQFTAEMENKLDAITNGAESHLKVLHDYWTNLSSLVNELKNNKDYSTSILDKVEGCCPDCGSGLVKRLGRYGEYVSCAKYPECKYVDKPKSEIAKDIKCPKCQSEAFEKISRKGTKYYLCTSNKCAHVFYPDPVLAIPPEERVTCPYCSQGTLIKRKSKYGFFYNCSRYPDCSIFVSDKEFAILKAGGEIEKRDFSNYKPKAKKKPANKFKPKPKAKGKKK